MNNQQAARECPWPDYAGNPIHAGDIIRHPGDGELGVVVFVPWFDDPHDAWRAVYKLGNGDLQLARLCLQIDWKGKAVVVPNGGDDD